MSNGDWDITTSGFEIQTSAILEFYYWFRSRQVGRNLHVILHQATEFRPNRSIQCRNMTSYPFIKMVAATAKYYFRFRICWCYGLQNVKIYQTKFRRDITHWRLRYNYFLFRNTNVRHIGILLPVSISTISPLSASHSASGCRISSKSEHPLCKNDVIPMSQNGGRDR